MKFTCAPESRPLSGYTIKRAIDRGAFGEVYFALSDAGKEVALKLIHQNQSAELRGVTQCLNLKHPNLVSIFDVRQDADGDHWVVMEYIAGESLEKRLSRSPGGLPMEEVLFWLEGLAAGVDYLHTQGVVHRDLKPANVFRERSLVKIADVGLSKFMTPSRRSAQTESVGTVYYMAPEVAHGRYGPELDLYSLGIMVYEMLTGQVPFDGESTGEILMKHLSQPPDLNRLPAALRPVLAHALAKDPQQRTRSATLFCAEFKAAVKAGPAGQNPHAAAGFTDGTSTAAGAGTAAQPDRSGAPGRDAAAEAASAGRAVDATHVQGDPLASSGQILSTVVAVALTAFVGCLALVLLRMGTSGRSWGLLSVFGLGVFIAWYWTMQRQGRWARWYQAWINRLRPASGIPGTSAASELFQAFGSPESVKATRILIVIAALAVGTELSMTMRGMPSWIGMIVFGIPLAAIGLAIVPRPRRAAAEQVSSGEAGSDRTFSAHRTTSSAANTGGAGAGTARQQFVVEPVVLRRTESQAAAASVRSADRPVTGAEKQTAVVAATPIEQFGQLCGSLALATVCAVLATWCYWIVRPIWHSAAGPVTTPQAGQFLFVTLVGSWLILWSGWLQSGKVVSIQSRRLVLGCCGILVGAWAWWLDELLRLDLVYDNSFEGIVHRIGSTPLLSPPGGVSLQAYVLFFLLLFGLRDWWKQVDPARADRWQTWTIVVSGFLGWILPALFIFPQTTGLLWAAALSFVVQMSALHCPPPKKTFVESLVGKFR